MPINLDKEFVNNLSALLEKAIVEVTSTLEISVKQKDPGSHVDFSDAVICSIGLTGAFNGNLIVVLPQLTACQLVSKMAGEELIQVSDDVLDGCREMTNMTAGVVMMGLVAKGCQVNIGLPTSLRGHAMHVRFNPIDKFVHQQYSSSVGDFEMIMIGRENESGIREQSSNNSIDNTKNALDDLMNKMKQNPWRNAFFS